VQQQHAYAKLAMPAVYALAAVYRHLDCNFNTCLALLSTDLAEQLHALQLNIAGTAAGTSIL
jgi:hypothetical protein